MTKEEMIHRLSSDPSLTSNLRADHIEQLLNWTEGRIEEEDAEIEFDRLCTELRLLNRYVGQGGQFEHLFVMLCNGNLYHRPLDMSRSDELYRGENPYPLTPLF